MCFINQHINRNFMSLAFDDSHKFYLELPSLWYKPLQVRVPLKTAIRSPDPESNIFLSEIWGYLMCQWLKWSGLYQEKRGREAECFSFYAHQLKANIALSDIILFHCCLKITWLLHFDLDEWSLLLTMHTCCLLMCCIALVLCVSFYSMAANQFGFEEQ